MARLHQRARRCRSRSRSWRLAGLQRHAAAPLASGRRAASTTWSTSRSRIDAGGARWRRRAALGPGLSRSSRTHDVLRACRTSFVDADCASSWSRSLAVGLRWRSRLASNSRRLQRVADLVRHHARRGAARPRCELRMESSRSSIGAGSRAVDVRLTRSIELCTAPPRRTLHAALAGLARAASAARQRSESGAEHAQHAQRGADAHHHRHACDHEADEVRGLRAAAHGGR